MIYLGMNKLLELLLVNSQVSELTIPRARAPRTAQGQSGALPDPQLLLEQPEQVIRTQTETRAPDHTWNHCLFNAELN